MTPRSLALLALALSASSAYAAEADLEIAKHGQDPVAPMGLFGLRNETGFGMGARGRTRNETRLEGAIPIAPDWADLLYRAEVPLVWQPVDYARRGGAYGLGDLDNLLYVTPKAALPVDLGAGPLVRLPIATDSTIGQHKWSVGLAAAVGATPGRWVLALSAAQVWSLFGPSSYARVNQLELRPVLSYHLPGGYYLTSQPTLLADWTAHGSDRWLIPLGGGVGRLFSPGSQKLLLSLEAYAPVVHPSTTSWSDFTIQLRFAFLFPSR
jgi:hypothetical protein